MGAQWINDSNQSHIWAWARKLNLTPVVQNINGLVGFEDTDGMCHFFLYGESPQAEQAGIDDMNRVRDLVESTSLDPETFKGPKRQYLESISVEQWARSIGAGARGLVMLGCWVRGSTGQENAEISALSFLEIARGGLGVVNLRHDGKHGGQYMRLKEDTQSIAKGTAKQLPPKSIRLNTPVVAVSQANASNNQLYVITTANRLEITARKVIISTPTPVYKEITFNPDLPQLKKLSTIGSRYECFVKFIALFWTPFWREKGACGLGQSFRGPINHCLEVCIDDEGSNAIATFMNGTPGRRWMTLKPEERV